MAINFSSSAGLNFDTLNNTLSSGIQVQESRLRDTLSGIGSKGGEVSQADLLMMQQEIQRWSILVDLQSTMVKQLSDAMKGVIQRSS